MARIAGINIPLNKRVEVGLTYVYGIGRSSSNRILKEAEVDPNTSPAMSPVRRVAGVVVLLHRGRLRCRGGRPPSMTMRT